MVPGIGCLALGQNVLYGGMYHGSLINELEKQLEFERMEMKVKYFERTLIIIRLQWRKRPQIGGPGQVLSIKFRQISR
jgi:hypothetical protein